MPGSVSRLVTQSVTRPATGFVTGFATGLIAGLITPLGAIAMSRKYSHQNLQEISNACIDY
jgi:hypothetical protein